MIIYMLVWMCTLPSLAQRLDTAALHVRIGEIVCNADAHVGVAVVSGGGDTLTVNGDMRYPLLSVFKFHQALAVCDKLRQLGQPLDIVLDVSADELEPDTWSPMRDAFPSGGRFTVRQLLDYTLCYSDNNACDILFSRLCSLDETSHYIASLGISDFCLECNEKMMHDDIMNCYRNWSSPLSAALLLEAFYPLRSEDEYSEYVWNTMASCSTGEGRLPRYVTHNGAVVAHKTGTGDTLPDGRIMAVNDIGVIVMPYGSHLSIAVFVSDAACTMAQCDELIARIAEAVLETAIP
ncbi:MAG: class A beta-lactamase [Clostridium sp.]|nr:class A beta-lactamase [Bacteroides sp.]MCM1199109.1 class A beta-lactamase [Clostridium sp.]